MNILIELRNFFQKTNPFHLIKKSNKKKFK